MEFLLHDILYGPIYLQINIGLDNSLAPNWCQANILTNGDPFQQRIYVSLWDNELISFTFTDDYSNGSPEEEKKKWIPVFFVMPHTCPRGLGNNWF